jgi:hypothetical protein
MYCPARAGYIVEQQAKLLIGIEERRADGRP